MAFSVHKLITTILAVAAILPLGVVAAPPGLPDSPATPTTTTPEPTPTDPNEIPESFYKEADDLRIQHDLIEVTAYNKYLSIKTDYDHESERVRKELEKATDEAEKQRLQNLLDHLKQGLDSVKVQYDNFSGELFNVNADMVHMMIWTAEDYRGRVGEWEKARKKYEESFEEIKGRVDEWKPKPPLERPVP